MKWLLLCRKKLQAGSIMSVQEYVNQKKCRNAGGKILEKSNDSGSDKTRMAFQEHCEDIFIWNQLIVYKKVSCLFTNVCTARFKHLFQQPLWPQRWCHSNQISWPRGQILVTPYQSLRASSPHFCPHEDRGRRGWGTRGRYCPRDSGSGLSTSVCKVYATIDSNPSKWWGCHFDLPGSNLGGFQTLCRLAQ